MAEILLVNPRRRRRKARKMSALQRKYFGKRLSSAAPKRRRRRASARKKNPIHRRHSVRVTRRRYHKNPSFGGLSIGGVTRSFVPTVKAGAIGAVGALLNDVAYGYTKGYLPTMMTTGNAAIATRALYAVVTGMLGNMILRGKGRDLSVGAMTVVIHDAGKAVLSGMLPSLPLGEYLSSGPAVGYSGVRRLSSNAVNLNGLGRVGRVGQYMSGVGRMGDSEFSNGIPAGY